MELKQDYYQNKLHPKKEKNMYKSGIFVQKLYMNTCTKIKWKPKWTKWNLNEIVQYSLVKNVKKLVLCHQYRCSLTSKSKFSMKDTYIHLWMKFYRWSGIFIQFWLQCWRLCGFQFHFLSKISLQNPCWCSCSNVTFAKSKFK